MENSMSDLYEFYVKKSLDILLILDGGVKAFNLFSYIIIMWVGTLQRGKFQWKFISFTFKKFCDGVKTTKSENFIY